MSLIVGEDVDSLGLQCYSRKEKSLGLLVSNFLRLYNRDDVDLIGLDAASVQLGVERRRIYDVVNILESLGVVARKGKNQYSWKGFGEVPLSLNELKEQGMRQGFGILSINNTDKVSNDDDEREESLILTPDNDHYNSSFSKMDHKKEKSLLILSQNFVKMFLCSHEDLITLDSAAKALLSDSQDPNHMRTKVRRLYDIANVLASMELIEKTRIPGTRKPAYKWLGSKSLTEKGSTLFNPSDPKKKKKKKKRLFGTEITNLTTKRSKTDCSSNRKQIGKHKKHDEEKTEKESEEAAAKSYVFGPFSPTGSSKKNNIGTNNKLRLQDLEGIACTYKPKYCNNEISGLLGHYTGAWSLWYAKLDQK
ncbi:unnamed protein product [Cochlearia groenlandica]